MKGLEDIANKYDLELILMFGSQVNDSTHSESDIDIAVYSKKPITEEKKIQLVYELALILKNERVDLVDIKMVSPLLKKKIFENYRVLYQKERFLVYQLELSALKEFKESKVLYDIRHERLKEIAK
jgi:predicted nucleotidyltransferase